MSSCSCLLHGRGNLGNILQVVTESICGLVSCADNVFAACALYDLIIRTAVCAVSRHNVLLSSCSGNVTESICGLVCTADFLAALCTLNDLVI